MEKIVLITGASSGIGLSLVQLCLNRGWKVLALDKETFTDECKHNKNLYTYDVDISNETVIKETFIKINKVFTQINSLVNCAAILENGDAGIESFNIRLSEKIFKTNIIGTMLICHHSLKLLKNVCNSSIVNVSSITALVGSNVPQLTYTASKGAIISFSKELAIELANENIRVNTVSPGLTETPLTASLLGGVNERAKKIPLKRFAKPLEIAKTIFFLMSEESQYITGSNIIIDGGLTSVNITTTFNE